MLKKMVKGLAMLVVAVIGAAIICSILLHFALKKMDSDIQKDTGGQYGLDDLKDSPWDEFGRNGAENVIDKHFTVYNGETVSVVTYEDEEDGCYYTIYVNEDGQIVATCKTNSTTF